MLNHTGCDNGNLLWRLRPCSCAECANSQKKENLRNFILTPALICLDSLLSHGGGKRKILRRENLFLFSSGLFSLPHYSLFGFSSLSFRCFLAARTWTSKIIHAPEIIETKEFLILFHQRECSFGGDAMIVKRLGMIFMKTVAFGCR